jgi:hypothetical protein
LFHLLLHSRSLLHQFSNARHNLNPLILEFRNGRKDSFST